MPALTQFVAVDRLRAACDQYVQHLMKELQHPMRTPLKSLTLGMRWAFKRQDLQSFDLQIMSGIFTHSTLF